MKVYQPWGVDKAYKYKWLARLAGFKYWLFKDFNQAKNCLFGKWYTNDHVTSLDDEWDYLG